MLQTFSGWKVSSPVPEVLISKWTVQFSILQILCNHHKYLFFLQSSATGCWPVWWMNRHLFGLPFPDPCQFSKWTREGHSQPCQNMLLFCQQYSNLKWTLTCPCADLWLCSQLIKHGYIATPLSPWEISVLFDDNTTHSYNTYDTLSSPKIWYPVTRWSKITEWLWSLHILLSQSLTFLVWPGGHNFIYCYGVIHLWYYKCQAGLIRQTIQCW